MVQIRLKWKGSRWTHHGTVCLSVCILIQRHMVLKPVENMSVSHLYNRLGHLGTPKNDP